MKPRILIADDCLSIQESFKGMITVLHHEIDCANSGKEALEFIKNNPYSYVIAYVDHNFIHTDDMLSRRVPSYFSGHTAYIALWPEK